VNLLKMLIGSKAKDKHLPFFWTKLSQEQLSAMLRAYFEGDGWIETNSVCVLTASKQLASDLLLALYGPGLKKLERELIIVNTGEIGTGRYRFPRRRIYEILPSI